jgi:hypothetical protein
MASPTKKNGCVPCGIGPAECTIEDDVDTNTGCVLQPDGTTKCPEQNLCGLWDINEGGDGCFIEGLVAESLKISGAPINVHKLLGIHEQTKLVDSTGDGSSMASSYLGNFPPFNAFNATQTEWRSAETGSDVVASAYIGYDFGPIRMENGRLQYGIETYVKKTISSLRIVQGCNKENRATKIRVERSHEGTKWFGVALLNVIDCDGVVTLNFNETVPSRFWRIRPVAFNGGPNDYWTVKSLQLSEFQKTDIKNIEDIIYLENRDRSYQTEPVVLKGSYTPPDRQSINSKFGFMFDSDTYYVEVSFKEMVRAIGRPIVIGDIIELPSEVQYNVDLTGKKAYFEVNDTSWSSSSYTPQWKPTLFKITMKPAFASQETQDIMGPVERMMDNTGLFNIDNGKNAKYQDYSDSSQAVKAQANTNVPENGIDLSHQQKLSPELIQWGKDNGKDMSIYDRSKSPYGQDAMPPNGEKYTEGDVLPDNNKEADYHRLTYKYLPGGNTIPARLYVWNKQKGTWRYIQKDKRFIHRNAQTLVNDMKNPAGSTVTALTDIEEVLLHKK